VTASTPPFIECEKMHASFLVSNLSAAIEFYVKKLGVYVWGAGDVCGYHPGEDGVFFAERYAYFECRCGVFVVGDADTL
jgi:catechol 2,3-dioxygenase-like lactoylglutathione lyase family enzyme